MLKPVQISQTVYMLNSNHVYLYPSLSSGNLRLLRVAFAPKIRFHSLLIRITSSGRKLMHVEEKPIKQKTAILVQICNRVYKLHKK